MLRITSLQAVSELRAFSLQSALLSLLVFISILVPDVVSAADFDSVLGTVSRIINGVIGLLITLALVVFFWGLITYLAKMSDESAKKGMSRMIWGIVALFVMVSIWGIVKLVQSTFGVQDQRLESVPGGFIYDPSGRGASSGSAGKTCVLDDYGREICF